MTSGSDIRGPCLESPENQDDSSMPVYATRTSIWEIRMRIVEREREGERGREREREREREGGREEGRGHVDDAEQHPFHLFEKFFVLCYARFGLHNQGPYVKTKYIGGLVAYLPASVPRPLLC